MRFGRKKLRQICGARNRRGEPCQCKLLLRGGRCRFHGGLSTGPRTPDGKARSLAALREGWRRWRLQRLRPIPRWSKPDRSPS
jgi:hypothetical protein